MCTNTPLNIADTPTQPEPTLAQTWCVISGRRLMLSRSFFFKIVAWSDEFSSWNERPTCDAANLLLSPNDQAPIGILLSTPV